MEIGGLAAAIGYPLWEKLVDAGRRRTYGNKEILMVEGQPVRHVHALIKGRVKITRVDADGNTTVFAVRGPGEVLGEIGALSGSVRSATVLALEECEVSVIEVAHFNSLVEELDIEQPLLAHLSRKIQDNNRLRSEIACKPAGVRLARALVHLADYAVTHLGAPPEGAIDLGLHHEDLANVVRLSRQTVSAELARLRDDGFIATPRGHVVVVALSRLRSHSEMRL